MHTAVLPTAPAPQVPAAMLSVCKGLGTQAAGRIAAISKLRRLAPREVLFLEGDTADHIYEIVSGMLRLYKLLPDGRRQIMGFPTGGHLLGLAPEGVHVYSAEAINEVTLCCYPRSSFDRLVDNLPGLARRLWTVTSDELRFAQDQMLTLGRRCAIEKVASFLVSLAEATPGQGGTITLPVTRGDMADYLGLTLETVSRALSKLRRDGVLDFPAVDRVRFLDRERLSDIAAGEA
jgi:CRP/FNR family transcriptional regulator